MDRKGRPSTNLVGKPSRGRRREGTYRLLKNSHTPSDLRRLLITPCDGKQGTTCAELCDYTRKITHTSLGL